jgi:hypothetical protein
LTQPVNFGHTLERDGLVSWGWERGRDLSVAYSPADRCGDGISPHDRLDDCSISPRNPRGRIVIGHWLFAAPFTATSMIGFIALAGIIVRNSILLVDFIRHGASKGKTLREVLLEAGAVRFKPILLTALAAMIGAATILLDPIFQGLAISLLFGLASSTLLTVLVIPAIYVVLRDADRNRLDQLR